MDTLIKTVRLGKSFFNGPVEVPALRDISLEIKQGEMLVILGPSGSGKSTLLNIIGGMDVPTAGEILYRNQPLQNMTAKQLTMYRRNVVGFIFQFYNLIPNLTALENVALVAELAQKPLNPAEVLSDVGLGDRKGHFPAQLSGGEQQRVALARALAKNPDIMLADEPTGALDFQTGKQVLHLLQKFNREMGKTVIIITHNSAIGNMAHRVVYIKDGRIDRIQENSNPVSADDISW
ncbi:MAG TPA: ABC transporter ATP-binding protein [Bacillota bacterium]|nr:ABC transporter ATP-binding protein [Bacillota bacterium]